MRWWTLSLLGASSALALPAGLSGNSTTYALNSTGNSVNGTIHTVVHPTTTTIVTDLASIMTTTTKTYEDATATSVVTVQETAYAFPFSKFGAIPTLLPTIPDDHDMDDHQHLTPQRSGSGSAMHYIQPSILGSYDASVFAIVTPNFKNPSVVLDHSAHVTVTAPNDNTLVVTFSDANAFAHGQDNWGTEGGVLFVTYTDGCGGFDNGERCYFSASAATYDGASLVVVVTGVSIPLQDAVHDANVVWGSYSPAEIDSDSPFPAASSGSMIEPFPAYSGGGDDNNPTAASTTPGTDVAYSPVPTTYSEDNTMSAGPTATGADIAFSPLPTISSGPCVAPEDTVYGLPTACLGNSFDQVLDDNLGYDNSSGFGFDSLLDDVTLDTEEDDDDYYSEDNTNDEQFDYILDDHDSDTTIINGISSTGSGEFGSTVTVSKRNAHHSRREVRLRKRKIEFFNKIKSAATSLKDTVKKAGTSVVSAAKSIGTLAYNIITGKPNVFDTGVSRLLLPRNSTDCNNLKTNCKPIDSKTKIVDSPWGDAILLKSFGTQPSENEKTPSAKKTVTVTSGKYVNLYCVKCGVSGGAKIAGNITINGLQGITAGQASASFDMTIGVGLGVDAQAVYQKQFKNNLYDFPLSPFTLGFVTIGPILSLGTDLTFTANATGRVLARGEFSIARANWTYDFVKGQATQVGFKPEFRPSVEAEGQVSVSVEFGLPIGLELAVTVFDGCTRCKGSVGIIEEPALKAEAAFALEANVTKEGVDSAGIKTLNNCTGISTVLSFNNKVSAAVKGFGFAEKEWTIHKLEDIPLKSWCIGNKTNGSDSSSKSSKTRRDVPLLYHRDVNNSSAVAIANSTAGNYTLLDLTEYVISNATEVGYRGPDIATKPYDLAEDYLDGYDFTTLVLANSSGDYVLSACSDDNIYIQPANSSDAELGYFTQCNSLWQRFEDVVLSTPNGGILHYYNNTMSKVGVSRLRTGDQEHLPESSVYVGLVPLDADEGGDSDGMLVAVDSSFSIFYPAVCTYNSTNDASTTVAQGAKIFLVKDPVDGLNMLQNPDIEYSITGGPVKECFLLPLVEGSDVQGQWAEYDGDDDAEDDTYDFELDADAKNA